MKHQQQEKSIKKRELDKKSKLRLLLSCSVPRSIRFCREMTEVKFACSDICSELTGEPDFWAQFAGYEN